MRASKFKPRLLFPMDRYGILSIVLVGSYFLSAVGLVFGMLNTMSTLVGAAALLVLVVDLSYASSRGSTGVSFAPQTFAEEDKLRWLEFHRFFASGTVYILPIVFLGSFAVFAANSPSLLQAWIAAAIFELAYVLYSPLSKLFREAMLDMTDLGGAVALASLAQCFLLRNERKGIEYLRRSVRLYRGTLRIEGLSSGLLDKLAVFVALHELHVKKINFEALADLASSFDELPFYEMFSDKAESILSQPEYEWTKSFHIGEIHSRPKLMEKLVGFLLSIVIVIASIVPEQSRVYFLSLVQEANARGLGEAIFATVVLCVFVFLARPFFSAFYYDWIDAKDIEVLAKDLKEAPI